MTILQKLLLQSASAHAARGWHRFGRGDLAVRYTEAWEHETFAEEQARWERSDPAYARICEDVRRAKETGREASRRAEEAKADWDARVATQRQADDDAQREHHALKADQTASAREGHHPMHTTFAIESNDSQAAGIIPEPVRVHDERAAMTAPRGEPQAARLRFRGLLTHPVSDEPAKVEVE
jgi:hypothetical protein